MMGVIVPTIALADRCLATIRSLKIGVAFVITLLLSQSSTARADIIVTNFTAGNIGSFGPIWQWDSSTKVLGVDFFNSSGDYLQVPGLNVDATGAVAVALTGQLLDPTTAATGNFTVDFFAGGDNFATTSFAYSDFEGGSLKTVSKPLTFLSTSRGLTIVSIIGGGGSSGTTNVIDFQLTNMVFQTQTAAVPEPPTWALAAFLFSIGSIRLLKQRIFDKLSLRLTLQRLAPVLRLIPSPSRRDTNVVETSV
jgi:hypothetical protein